MEIESAGFNLFTYFLFIYIFLVWIKMTPEWHGYLAINPILTKENKQTQKCSLNSIYRLLGIYGENLIFSTIQSLGAAPSWIMECCNKVCPSTQIHHSNANGYGKRHKQIYLRMVWASASPSSPPPPSWPSLSPSPPLSHHHHHHLHPHHNDNIKDNSNNNES